VPDLELTTESGEHIGMGEQRGQMIVLYHGSGSAEEQGPSRRSNQGRVEALLSPRDSYFPLPDLKAARRAVGPHSQVGA
jgi:hypothetical protein